LPFASWVRNARSASEPLGRFPARAGLALVALLIVAGTVGFALPASAQATGKGAIALVSQDPWVQTSSIPIRLGLKVHSSVPESDLSVTVALYTEPDGSALASRDEFEATLAGQFAGLSQLPQASFAASSLESEDGAVELYVGGSGLPGKIPKRAPPGQVFQLPCPQRSGGCEGVYPLQVSLVDTITGLPLDSFTTYLIVVPVAVASQKRLRFSFILPVGGPLALTPAGNPALPRATIGRIDTIARETTKWPTAPLTVDLYGQSLLALARSRAHANFVAAVAAGGIERLVPSPFSAVDPTELARADLGEELDRQIQRGRAVALSVFHVPNPSRIYVATVPIGIRGLAALAASGIKQIVLPESNLQALGTGPPASVQWPYTLSAPFRIAGSAIEGIQSDTGLVAHLTDRGSTALRAQQLLADLAELYFDAPDYPEPRGVALLAPPSWTPERSFLDATLHGLESSPIVSTVPLSQLFYTVPPGICAEPPVYVSGCSPAVRSIANPPNSAGRGVTLSEVVTARIQLAELSSVIPTAKITLGNLDDAVLLAETAGIGSRARVAYLSASLAHLRLIGAGLSLPAGRTVTVTSASARIPIAITSRSKTPVHVTLVISGANLTSPTTKALVLNHGTTAFIVRVTTRTSGDSSLQLQLLSPTGGLVLTGAEFTIRSTAISGVAIGLTAGAGAFLLIWWLRSAFRRRRRRAGENIQDQGHRPASGAIPEPAS